MSAPAIFVSHSHKDDAYCHAFVAALRAAGLDVWYDEHNATAGHLRALIERELRLRPIFVVVLTPAALASEWVTDECDWAYNLYRRDRASRVILPVLAETVNEDDIWLFMQQFKRIEQAGLQPWPAAEAARRVALALDPNAQIATAMPVAPSPQPTASPDRSDELDALLARANALVSQGKRRDAIAVLRQATTLAPRSVAAWNALGYQLDYVAYSQDEASEALEAFERALLLDPDNAFAWAGKSGVIVERSPAQSLVLADKALALDPDSVYGLSAKGAALQRQGRASDALAAYDRALALDPTYSVAWNEKGYILGTYGRHQESFDAYDRALALDPGYAVAWNNKGAALYRLERSQDALDAYDRALALEPRFTMAWSNRGVVLYKLERYHESLDALDHALELEQSAATWGWKALALRKLGRVKEAEKAERTAKELEGQQ